MPPPSELYERLGVAPDASDVEIRKAYKRRALQLHPDKTEGDDAAFKALNEAYSVLSDPERRRAYDAPPQQHHQQHQQHPHPSSFFSGFHFGGQHMPFNVAAQPSLDAVDIPVSLAEAYRGGRKNVVVSEIRICAPCRGSGAKDPEADVRACASCGGAGVATARVGPFMVTTGACGPCRGRGVSGPEPGHECEICKGAGGTMQQVPFTLEIPRGARHGHTTRFAGGGSFDAKRRGHNDVEMRVVHQVGAAAAAAGFGVVSIDPGSGRVTATLRVKVEEMLFGFDREISPWGRPMRARSSGYVRPDRPYVFAGLGFPGGSDGGHLGDLSVTLEIEYTDRLEVPASSSTAASCLEMTYIGV